MRILLMLAALLTWSGTASAQDWYLNKSCAGETCVLQGGRPSNTGIAKIIKVPKPESVEEQADVDAREAEWTDVCEPIVVRDAGGVSRYTFGPACPNGVVVGNGRRPR